MNVIIRIKREVKWEVKMTSRDSCQTHVGAKTDQNNKIPVNQNGIVLPAWPHCLHSKMFQGSIQFKYIIHGHIVMNFDTIKLKQ